MYRGQSIDDPYEISDLRISVRPSSNGRTIGRKGDNRCPPLAVDDGLPASM